VTASRLQLGDVTAQLARSAQLRAGQVAEDRDLAADGLRGGADSLNHLRLFVRAGVGAVQADEICLRGDELLERRQVPAGGPDGGDDVGAVLPQEMIELLYSLRSLAHPTSANSC